MKRPKGGIGDLRVYWDLQRGSTGEEGWVRFHFTMVDIEGTACMR